MPKKEAPLDHLESFLPKGSMEGVMEYLHAHKVHLTITRQRKTVLGDYRNKVSDKNHRITVNGNLNKYSFLITLLHEIAHLLAFEKYGHRISPHGREWKDEFGRLLAGFILKKIFPDDIKRVLLKTLQNPGASSCADIDLMRVLRRFDSTENSLIIKKVLIEEISLGTHFIIPGGRIFSKGEKIRTRFRCTELSTNKIYLFSPIYEVVVKDKV